jgi:hypothetical protein
VLWRGHPHRLRASDPSLGPWAQRRRRLQPLHRRLAGFAVAAYRPGVGRAGDGNLAPAGPAGRAGASLGQGSQYLSIRYTERLAEAGAVTSVGSVGDAFDNAWPRRSSACTRPSSSAGAAHGRASTRSSTPPWSGSTGSTTAGSWSPSATCPRPSSRRTTIEGRPQAASTHSSNRASGEPEPGAVHTSRTI